MKTTRKKDYEKYIGVKFTAPGHGKVEYEVRSINRIKNAAKDDTGYLVILYSKTKKEYTETSLYSLKKFVDLPQERIS